MPLLRILFLVAVFLGCSASPPRATDPMPSAPWTTPTREAAARLASHLEQHDVDPAMGLTVLLAFEAGADLDLYVSDPLSETLYYANTPARSGGRLTRDVHCKNATPGIQVEAIVFEVPPSGAYRVGVDYAHRCEPGTGPVAFVLHIHDGSERHEVDGVIEPITFLPFLAEIDITR